MCTTPCKTNRQHQIRARSPYKPKHEVADGTPEFNLVEEKMVKEAADNNKVGAVVSQKLWAVCNCTALVFLVRLTRKGFMPICPKLVTKFDIVLMPGTGIQLL